MDQMKSLPTYQHEDEDGCVTKDKNGAVASSHFQTHL